MTRGGSARRLRSTALAAWLTGCAVFCAARSRADASPVHEESVSDAAVQSPSVVSASPASGDVGMLPSLAVSEDARPIVTAGSSTDLKYLLERVEITGNRTTRASLVRSFVPVETGATLDVNDPEIEALRYRLLGTGWYDRVDLRLKRGSRPGWVVLVIALEERSTLVFQQLAAGVGWSVEGVGRRRGDQDVPRRQAEPYLGLALAETNFLGSGRTLSGEVLASPDQGGMSLTFFTPVVRATRWSFRARATVVKGREYFGGDHVRVSAYCADNERATSVRERCELQPPVAVVDYWRAGLSLGTARDVGPFTRLSLEWHGDFVKVPSGGMPISASELRGRGDSTASITPIDFSIEPGRSVVSMVTVGLLYDKRDSAVLPSRGSMAMFSGDLASPLIASDYGFVRVQASYNHWLALPWGHTVRTGVFAGALYGYAPFFYKFFVTDLTDLQPSRILGLNLDHRPAPNLLGLRCGVFDSECGTAIAQMRQEELAARVDAEYVWPLVRGRRKFVKGADTYFLFGVYGLADAQDLRVGLPGYRGAARAPIDLTIDAGVRLDTQIGVFQIGLAKLAWLPFQ